MVTCLRQKRSPTFVGGGKFLEIVKERVALVRHFEAGSKTEFGAQALMLHHTEVKKTKKEDVTYADPTVFHVFKWLSTAEIDADIAELTSIVMTARPLVQDKDVDAKKKSKKDFERQHLQKTVVSSFVS